MSKLPYFKFYPQDFIMGTFDLDNELTGIYIKMLCFCWEKKYIPAKAEQLQKMFRANEEQICIILDKFTKTELGYINERIEDERNKATEKSFKMAENARQKHNLDNKAKAEQLQSKSTAEAPISQKSEVRSQNTEFILNTLCDKSHYECDFNSFWVLYPADRRRKKTECKKIYARYCTSRLKEEQIRQALNNYKQSEDFKRGFIQLSITWFRDWETWIDYKPEKKNEFEGACF